MTSLQWNLDAGIVLLTVAIAIFYGLFKPVHCWAAILPFMLVFFFFFEWGTRWTPAKVGPAILLLLFFARSAIGNRSVLRFPPWVIRFTLVVIAGSVLSFFLRGDPTRFIGVAESGLLQRYGPRTFVQSAAYLVQMGFFLIPFWGIRGSEDSLRALRAYLMATSLLVCYGLYQMAAYYLNWPFRGIIYEAGREGFGIFQAAGFLVPRLNSLAYEPKMLAALLIPSLTLLFLVQSRIVAIEGGMLCRWRNLVLHGLVFLLTFALSGFIAFGLSTAVVLLIVWRAIPGRRSFWIAGRATLAALAIGVVFWLALPQLGIGEILGERYAGANMDRRTDWIVANYLLEHPLDALLGFGPGNYAYALLESGYVWVGAYGVAPLNAGIVALMADTGVIGVVIILMAMMMPVRRALATFRITQSGDFAVVFLTCCLAAGSMAELIASPSFSVLLFFGGIATKTVMLESEEPVA